MWGKLELWEVGDCPLKKEHPRQRGERGVEQGKSGDGSQVSGGRYLQQVHYWLRVFQQAWDPQSELSMPLLFQALAISSVVIFTVVQYQVSALQQSCILNPLFTSFILRQSLTKSLVWPRTHLVACAGLKLVILLS